MNPTASPASRLIVIRSSRRKIAAMTMTNSGTAALRIAASAESTVSSAQVISENGIAMLTAPMTMRWPYVLRIARQRLAGHGDDGRQERKADEQPQRDEHERRQPGVDADLDEQVAAAPEEAEQNEQEPVDSGGAGHGHLVIIANVGLVA